MIMMFYADEVWEGGSSGIGVCWEFLFLLSREGRVVVLFFFFCPRYPNRFFGVLLLLLGFSGDVCTTCTKIVSTVFPLLRRVTTPKKKKRKKKLPFKSFLSPLPFVWPFLS